MNKILDIVLGDNSNPDIDLGYDNNLFKLRLMTEITKWASSNSKNVVCTVVDELQFDVAEIILPENYELVPLFLFHLRSLLFPWWLDKVIVDHVLENLSSLNLVKVFVVHVVLLLILALVYNFIHCTCGGGHGRQQENVDKENSDMHDDHACRIKKTGFGKNTGEKMMTIKVFKYFLNMRKWK